MPFPRYPRSAQRNARRTARNPRYAPEVLEGRLSPSGFVPAYCYYAPIEYNPAAVDPPPGPAPLPPTPDPIMPPYPAPIPPSGPALTE